MGVYLPFTPRLPSIYQEVEYIESSGTQYIDTGVKPTNKTKVVNKGFLGNASVFYGVGRQSYYQSICLLTDGTNYRGRCRSSSSANSTVTSTIPWGTDVHIFEISQGGGFYIDGTKIGTFTSYTYTESYNIYVFGWSNRGTFIDGGIARLYYMEIYEDGTLIRNFIPCYRKSDTVIGLYDLVNNQFYTNSGSGTFSKGEDVTAVPLKNAYIGEVGEYTISNIPTTDTNVYVNVARSGKTIQSVTFKFIVNRVSNRGAYIQMSGNNSNTMRYGPVLEMGSGTGLRIRGRTSGSDTYFRTITTGYNSGGVNNVEFTINRDGTGKVVCNGGITNYTATGSELTIIQTIMNLSNMNVYAAQNASGILTDNKVDVTVTYS